MFNLRQANLQDLEALIQLRLWFLREASDIKGDFDTANLAKVTRKSLGEKMPSGKFLAWVAIESKREDRLSSKHSPYQLYISAQNF